MKILQTTNFIYNTAKNVSTGQTLFELNYSYHPQVSFKKDVNPCFKSRFADRILANIWELIIVCLENSLYAQKLQSKFIIKALNLEARRSTIKFD